jgi:hypothetical protein
MRIATGLFLLMSGSIIAGAQGSRLTLVVRDSAGQPVPYANVFVAGGSPRLTNDSGTVRVNLGGGATQLEIRRLGFRPTSLNLVVRGDTLLPVTIAALPTRLEEERISARAFDRLDHTGVYSRMLDVQNGLYAGGFITAEQIEKRNPVAISQMLEGSIACVRVETIKSVGGVPYSCVNNCPMTIYLDGARFDPYINVATGSSSAGAGSPGRAFTPAGSSASPTSGKGTEGMAVGLDRLVSPNEVAAMEVYPRAVSSPAMYQHMNGTCGIVAIWTK